MKIIDGGVNDIRITGTIALAIMIIICAVGMEWEIKAQNFLLAIIVAAIFNFIIGSSMGPSNVEQQAQGFTGINREFFTTTTTTKLNLNENFFKKLTFTQ